MTELPQVTIAEPEAATDGVLALAHAPAYIHRVAQGQLTSAEQRAIGFPWSEQMVERSRRSTGATIAASRSALLDGVGINLAGGTHHAHADRGEGFCVFNDAAVAARLMQAERRVRDVAIVDLDVHQGNGTATILARDSSVFTLSLHGAGNYPFAKAASDLDMPFPDETGDAAYLDGLDTALDQLFAAMEPDLILYLAGADPFENDRLGRLRLTKDGLRRRDERVLGAAHERGIPVAIAMAGGYGRRIEETVDIHFQTVRTAANYALAWNTRSSATPVPESVRS